jgi:type I restriction enzyme S subunit
MLEFVEQFDGFKKTEVGLFPKNWRVVKISEVGEIIRGASPRPKGDLRYYGGNIPRLMVEDVTRDGKYVTPTVDFLTEEGAKRSRPCKKGTLTIVCSGTVGIPSFLAVDACIHDGFLALVKIKKDFYDDYIYHQLSNLQKSFENSATHGGVFTNLTTAGVKEFLVVIPQNKFEQTAIANTLSDADILIENLEKLIVKKRYIKQGAMQELLCSKRPLMGFDNTWRRCKIGDILKIKHGKSQRDVQSNSGIIPILGTGGLLGYATEFLYNSESVLIGRKGTIDKPQFMDSPFWTVDTLFYTEIKKDISPKFIYYKFLLIDWYSYNEASGVPSLNAKTIEGIELEIPCFKTQKQIAHILTDMDNEIEALEQRLNKFKMIKQGMMQVLLSGKIRLI